MAFNVHGHGQLGITGGVASGDVGVTVYEADGTTALARSTTGIVELGTNSGQYVAVKSITTGIPRALWIQFDDGLGNYSEPAMATPAAVEAQLNTRLLTALAMARLERSVGTIVIGTVGASATTTSIPLSAVDPVPNITDQFRGRILLFEYTASSSLRGEGGRIVGNTSGATPVLTVTALAFPPASGDLVAIT